MINPRAHKIQKITTTANAEQHSSIKTEYSILYYTLKLNVFNSQDKYNHKHFAGNISWNAWPQKTFYKNSVLKTKNIIRDKKYYEIWEKGSWNNNMASSQSTLHTADPSFPFSVFSKCPEIIFSKIDIYYLGRYNFKTCRSFLSNLITKKSLVRKNLKFTSQSTNYLYCWIFICLS